MGYYASEWSQKQKFRFFGTPAAAFLFFLWEWSGAVCAVGAVCVVGVGGTGVDRVNSEPYVKKTC